MFKLEFKRYIKTPINWIFSFVLPIGLTILLGEIYEGIYLKTGYIGIVILISMAITIIPVSISICSDQIEKRIKHYQIIKWAINKYMMSLFFANFVIFAFITNVVLCISFFIYNIPMDWNIAILFFAFSTLSFVLCFSISLILGFAIKTLSTIIPFSLLVFYILIIVSGVTFPFHFIFNWAFYLEVITPFGCMILLFNNSLNAINLENLEIIICVVVLLAYTIILTTFIIFIFKNK